MPFVKTQRRRSGKNSPVHGKIPLFGSAPFTRAEKYATINQRIIPKGVVS
jgi:hypothetical protein